MKKENVCPYCWIKMCRPFRIEKHKLICNKNINLIPKYWFEKAWKIDNKKLKKSYNLQLNKKTISLLYWKLSIINKKCKFCKNEFKIIDNKKYKFNKKEYCSTSCSNFNRKHSKKTIKKISNSILNYRNFHLNDKNSQSGIKCQKTKIYYNNCKLCFKLFISKNKKKKLCSKQCFSKNVIENNEKNNSIWFWYSWDYKWYKCDSSWELAYLYYNINNNIKFYRNNKWFEYIINWKKHLYYPDFIEWDTYVEIQWRKNNYWIEKLKQFNLKLKVLYKQDIKFYLNYVINKYWSNFIKLYSKNNIKNSLRLQNCYYCNKENYIKTKRIWKKTFCNRKCYLLSFKNK